MQTSSSSSSSTITNHSNLTSSSSSSSPFPQTSSQRLTRCIGLNLLVKAIHQVTNGSIIGVPYIQRRIITRRKRPVKFTNLIISTKPVKPVKAKKPTAKRQRRVVKTLPAKFKDFSVFQPLTRSERSSLCSSDEVEVEVEVDIIGD